MRTPILSASLPGNTSTTRVPRSFLESPRMPKSGSRRSLMVFVSASATSLERVPSSSMTSHWMRLKRSMRSVAHNSSGGCAGREWSCTKRS